MAHRNHKERSQPAHRARLGLLEKHKDYVLRARDYKSKQDRIKKLREKAAFKNKDEFYWGMIKSKTHNGIETKDRGNVALNTDLVKILKSQDLGYVRVQIAKDEKKIRDLKTQLQITAPSGSLTTETSSSPEWDAIAELAEVEKLAEMGIVLKPSDESTTKRKGKGKAVTSGHVIFADDKDEFENYGESSRSNGDERIEEQNDEPIDLGWHEPPISQKRKNKQKVIEPVEEVDEELIAEEAKSHRIELLTLLSAYLNRLKLLRQAEHKLETTKSLLGKGSARKIRDTQWVDDESQPESKNGERKRLEGKMWKWKLERRR
ncbi:U3 small nucleolar RNA-associated protein 11 [Kwoniella mangroviensis CBS 8886]|nr:U3 small nucleolar RNA-associated protein 11 [Kwoniella mangroviensis CBS 8886]